MKAVLLSLVLTAITMAEAIAYPIEPRPLRKLIIESQYIIAGYVVNTHDVNKKEDHRRYAQINILEQLQGKIREKTIEVSFTPGMICPAPAVYRDSTYVLAFLDKRDGSYYTHALSYGAKTLNPEEIALYKKRIAEMQEILKLTSEQERFTRTVEWLVTCAENKATRWEGTFELQPESDFMSHYSRDEGENFKFALNTAQRERLAKAFLTEAEDSRSSYGDFALGDLIYKGHEEEVDQLLIRRLKALPSEDSWLADDFMNRLKHRAEPAKVDPVLKSFNDIVLEYDKNAERKKYIDEFIKLVDY